jgi:hypothetical protein
MAHADHDTRLALKAYYEASGLSCFAATRHWLHPLPAPQCDTDAAAAPVLLPPVWFTEQSLLLLLLLLLLLTLSTKPRYGGSAGNAASKTHEAAAQHTSGCRLCCKAQG